VGTGRRVIPRHAPSRPNRKAGILMNPEAIRQHDTHNMLTPTAGPRDTPFASLGLDAIVVPASRPAAHLDHAVTLARAAGCWLLILCSGRLNSAEAADFLAARSYRKAIAIDLPSDYSHRLLRFPELDAINSELPEACGLFTTDISMKRNIGLVVARMLRWHRIFFLDDDIRDITYPNLQRTVDMLGSFSAAGLWVTDFPDNSIVCHANRYTGGSQDVFVSGAALVVNCESDIGFFPDIYNEDWLFMFDYASAGKLANSSLEATQLCYYPFAKAGRAAWQEFGDVIAEGLYSLLHLGLDVDQATRAYWTNFLEARRSFLEAILTRLPNAYPEMRDEIQTSVQLAEKCLQAVKPDLCERYVHAWRRDLADWKRRMAGIGRMPSIEAALQELGLTFAKSESNARRILPYWIEATPNVTAGAVKIPRFDTLPEMHTRNLHPSSSAVTQPSPVPTTRHPEAVSAAASACDSSFFLG
jgi:hypothetical protein